ncbi:hypothetical protein [Maridesulfovibrio hydrothermalis]|uniref:Uncharacterized protein n=1 Tax=Maridesulfovibrio hydrothermalis AM13 = DSM 14728 TaxID=1121451 RepID=L0RHC6_9BACT|nr:hypothetical protein [Maridesulfovibrio hydrothermalis]CCO24961.1 conserved protein of unknown function [Maridesulfovibrio hydrothermalis AM13 = DSM 14728]
MPGPVDMPIIISQLANVQKISNSEITKAQMQQTLMINPAEQEKNKEAQKQIQKIDKEEGPNTVQDEGSSNTQQHASSRRKKKEEKEQDEGHETKPSPWSGNIINVKI